MTPQPVRWGFLGAGFVASKALAPAVHAASNAKLQVVAARDADRAASLGPVWATTSYGDVCEAPDVDAVYLSLPNDAHFGWVRAALESGKHVLCEKPLALTAAEVEELAAVADRNGRLLVEAAWNRWHPRTRRLEELVESSPAPRRVRAWFTFDGVPEDNYRLDPEKGGGALYDVGCYAVATALSVIGPDAEVTRVHSSPGDTGVDLTSSAVITSELGAAEIRASFEEPEAQGIRVTAPGFLAEVPHPAFTSWREESTLRIVEGGVERVESFPACDAYQLMVEATSSRIQGEPTWVLPLSTSAAVANVLDQIRSNPVDK